MLLADGDAFAHDLPDSAELLPGQVADVVHEHALFGHGHGLVHLGVAHLRPPGSGAGGPRASVQVAQRLGQFFDSLLQLGDAGVVGVDHGGVLAGFEQVLEEGLHLHGHGLYVRAPLVVQERVAPDLPQVGAELQRRRLESAAQVAFYSV